MKMTNLISIIMAVSGALVVLGGILNSASVVAISSGVVGKQDGGWYGIVALLLGLSVTGVFVYAYRQSIWNWWIRGSLIALSGVIFLVSTIGMADNFRADFDGGSYTWTQGGNALQEETIRIVPQTFVVLDLDFVVVMMLSREHRHCRRGAMGGLPVGVCENRGKSARGDSRPARRTPAGGVAGWHELWRGTGALLWLSVPFQWRTDEPRSIRRAAGIRETRPIRIRLRHPCAGDAAPVAGQTNMRIHGSATPAAPEVNGVPALQWHSGFGRTGSRHFRFRNPAMLESVEVRVS